MYTHEGMNVVVVVVVVVVVDPALPASFSSLFFFSLFSYSFFYLLRICDGKNHVQSVFELDTDFFDEEADSGCALNIARSARNSM